MSGLSTTEITIRVAWADTDAAAIVWLGNFIRYIERVEEELFRACGHPRLDLMRENIIFPRTSLHCSFRSPARFDDELAVRLTVVAMSERRIGFGFHIHQAASKQVVVEGSYEVACVDALTFTGRAMPESLRAALAPHAT